MSSTYDFDLLVIGGGNGGLASAKRAAKHGAKVALVEASQFGGTGFTTGTIPKKMMYHCASVVNVLKHDAAHLGMDVSFNQISWNDIKTKREAFIKQLQEKEQKELDEAGITVINGRASFVDSHTVEIKGNDGSNSTVTGNKIILSLGSKPILPDGNGIKDHCVTSDDYFFMDKLPKKVVIAVQSEGYIGIEISYVLNALGCETHFAIRGPTSMRYCDTEVNKVVDDGMEQHGVKIYRNSGGVSNVSANGELKTVTLNNGTVIEDVDTVIFTPMRTPSVEGMNLEKAGVAQRGELGYISVDEYHRTSVPHIYAVGDVTTEVHQLTPKIVAAARRVADLLFGGVENAKVTFENTPYAFFSYPTIANAGLTEEEAGDKFGAKNVKVYRSNPDHLYHSMWNMSTSDKPKTFIKMVCAGADEKVVGLHLVGQGAEEALQGFAVAMKMGATKADFDSCMSIEPTLAGEVVTMGEWGSSPQHSGAKVSPLMGSSAAQPILK